MPDLASERPYALPLKITTTYDGTPSILLAGQELSGVLASDGLRIEFVTEPTIGIPLLEVTMKFAGDGLELDFDVDLLERMLHDAREKAAYKAGEPVPSDG